MGTLRPFAYPVSPHQRRHGPGGYKNYPEYKDWLRDEFTFRCVYCLERESWYPTRQAAFAVEHALPRATHPHLECLYFNLLYACLRCNCFKQDTTTLDPTSCALADHLRVDRGGTVTPLTPEGQEYVKLLHLNSAVVVEGQRRVLAVLGLKRDYPDDPRVDRLYRQTFGFPEDLPDLDAKRPPTNDRPEGLRETFFRQRAERRLADPY